MQVTIKYSQQYGQCAGGVETLNTPMLQEYDRWRIGFKCLEYNHHWALVIEKYFNNSTLKILKEGKWEYDRKYGILLESDTPCCQESYLAWLNTFVEMIEVDGREFWVNKTLIDNNEGEYYGK